jgi:hypothetical protein
MASFAMYLNAGAEINLSIAPKSLNANGAVMSSDYKQMNVTTANLMIVQVQNLELGDDVANMRLTSSGVGTVYGQIVQHYYMPDNKVEPFIVTVEVENDTLKRRRRSTLSEATKDICLRMNVKSSGDGDVGSGMTLLLVEHPSGYVYDTHKELGDGQFIKRYETDGEKTTFYFDDLMKERQVRLCMKYETKVANPKPAFVTVQDYYNPTSKSDVPFILENRQGETACDICGCDCLSQCSHLEKICSEDAVDSGEPITSDTNSKSLFSVIGVFLYLMAN